jgi:hypothetical protein
MNCCCKLMSFCFRLRMFIYEYLMCTCSVTVSVSSYSCAPVSNSCAPAASCAYKLLKCNCEYLIGIFVRSCACKLLMSFAPVNYSTASANSSCAPDTAYVLSYVDLWVTHVYLQHHVPISNSCAPADSSAWHVIMLGSFFCALHMHGHGIQNDTYVHQGIFALFCNLKGLNSKNI